MHVGLMKKRHINTDVVPPKILGIEAVLKYVTPFRKIPYYAKKIKHIIKQF